MNGEERKCVLCGHQPKLHYNISSLYMYHMESPVLYTRNENYKYEFDCV